MDRRSFLRILGGAAGAAVVAPKVSYFFAPAAGWNTKCLPKCMEHLHTWQVEQAVRNMEKSVGQPFNLHGMPYYVIPWSNSLGYAGISRDLFK